MKAMQLGNKGASIAGSTSSLSVIPYLSVGNNGYYGSDANWKYYDGSYGASLYQQAASEHRWSIAGTGTTGNTISFTQAMTLDNSGNLGVGTSSPNQKLYVVGNGLFEGGFTYWTVTASTPGSTSPAIWSPATGAMGFWANSAERMRLDSAGNLGLGTTPSAWSSRTAIQVGAASSISYFAGGGTSAALTVNQYFNGSNHVYIANGYACSYQQSSGQHVWSTAPSGTAGTAISFTQAMTLDASGNLNIGASNNPSSRRLSVNGIIGIQDASTERMFLTWDGTKNQIVSVGATDLTFWANYSERMRIASSGNLGIGTTSPDASAILDAQSTTKGVRFPNMTTTQKNAIASPAAGLVVFDTTLAKLCLYTGAAWQTITSV